jgi:aminopeptidase N
MGAIFLQQLKYIIGEENFYKGMRRYFNTWKFKHPEPNDFLRVMEKVSGMQLHWYYRYFINTTKTIDYGVRSVVENEGATYVTLSRIGEFPMPVDLLVTFRDGTKELYYIPMNEMLGNKPVENDKVLRNDLVAWPWVNQTYSLRINRQPEDISSIEIDPTQRMADVNRRNNKFEFPQAFKAYQDPTQ